MTVRVGSVDQAIGQAIDLLGQDPALACHQAREILRVAPAHPSATLILGVGMRRAGQCSDSKRVLEELVAAHPRWALGHLELGLTQGALGAGDAAIVSLRTAVELKADLPDAWRALADHLSASGDAPGAAAAHTQQILYSIQDPRLANAAQSLLANDIPVAERLLRAHLHEFPTDVVAMRMFAEVAARLERYVDAENLLSRCLDLAPQFEAARRNFAIVLHRQHKNVQALDVVEQLLSVEPRNPSHWNLKASILAGLGRYAEAIDLYARILEDYPGQETVWLNYGHALKTAGRQGDSIAAYRRCIELSPGMGAAYWSLANLKTYRFNDADLRNMEAQLASQTLPEDERIQFHFAAGKALEDARRFEEAFDHYTEGNRLRRGQSRYCAQQSSLRMQRYLAIFNEEFFAARKGFGHPSDEPIFIVGLPRSGSTLLEQILASHTQVEGTMELSDLMSIARESNIAMGSAQCDVELSRLTAEDCRKLGQRYLERTRIQRQTGAGRFIDKMPNNFPYVGLIQLILPNAKIIDARRAPLACCWSIFKQYFARGQHFAYGSEDLGSYYRDYLNVMAHFDRVTPDAIHHVLYESVVLDTPREVERLLAYCGLPFEEGCLRFYENKRAVRTASSEQVRRPINSDGVDQWRHFEPWLSSFRAALGPALDTYRETIA